MEMGFMLWSVHEEAERDMETVLREASRAGYRGVEFAGYFAHSAATLRAWLTRYDLLAAGSHIAYPASKEALDAMLSSSKELGLESITVTAVPTELKTADDFKRRGHMLAEISRKLGEQGIACGYQNHDFEFVRFGELWGLDLLMREAEGSPLFLEMETFWVERCGVRAADYIRRYAGRLRNIHLKDWTHGEAPVSCPLGDGVAPLAQICEAAERAGTKWLLVKQEHYQNDAPMQAMQRSAKFLSQLLQTSAQ